MPADPYKYFRIEARDLSDQLVRGFLDLEKAASTGEAGGLAEIVSRLLRLAHTLKGAARVVKQKAIAELAHEMEALLVPLRDGPGPQAGQIAACLKLADDLAACLSGLPAAENPEPAPAAAQPQEPLRIIHADTREMDALSDGMSELSVRIEPVRRAVASLQHSQRLTAMLEERREDPVLEELRISLAVTERSLAGGLEQIEREIRQVRDVAEQLRLVPVSAMFPSLERAARDAGQQLQRDVTFTSTGADVRFAADILAGVQSALIQAVRNAVAHGIEAREARRAAGKPAAGRIAIVVSHRGGEAVFCCEDDGRGVDLEAVTRVARARSTPPSGPEPGTEELLAMLLAGGLSTSSRVTEVSGRGIGLDVVRATAERLGGSVRLRTESGRGTTLELAIPISLSSIQALFVEASGITAAIPLRYVRRAIRVLPEQLVSTPGGAMIQHQGAAIPFVPLARSLGITVPAHKRVTSALVVEAGGRSVAVQVDRIVDIGPAVLRSLPRLAVASPVVAGTFMDAAGNPQIVVNPEELVSEAIRHPAAVPEPRSTPIAPILVVDDSLTTRMLEQSILESAGYEVELATSAEEALEKARRRRYALFLVDVEMPGMDGFAFVATITGDVSLRDIPAILVTSRSAPEDRLRGKQVGARAYVVKSEFDQARLLETIRTLVGGT